MKSERRFAFVFVTAPNVKAARALARKALEARFIACANLIPKLSRIIGGKEKSSRPARS